jgi:hypothetical protein
VLKAGKRNDEDQNRREKKLLPDFAKVMKEEGRETPKESRIDPEGTR